MKISSNCNISSANVWFSCAILVILAFPAVSNGQRRAARQILNPYERVDWQKYGQFRANLNAHTMVGTGWMNPQSVVEEYKQAGYHILAITDLNSVTFPWESFSGMKAGEIALSRIAHIVPKPFEETSIPLSDTLFRDISPSEAGMVAVRGWAMPYEKQRVNGYFSDITGGDGNVPDLTDATNGLAVLSHPGTQKASVYWYTDFFKRHHLKGLEIFTSNSRHAPLTNLWDSLLMVFAPEKPVWGFSNDAFFSGRDLGKNWNVFLLPFPDEKEVRLAMEKGAFYLVHAPMGPAGPRPPLIKSIQVDQERGTIRIKGAGHHSIAWISNGVKTGRGAKFRVRKLADSGTYVRAELYGQGNSIVCTQPFLIR